MIGLAESWTYWLPWLYDWQSPVLVFRMIRIFGPLVPNILVVSLRMVFFTEMPGFTPQLRRVMIGGLCGVAALIILRTVVVEMNIVFQLFALNDHLSLGTFAQLISILSSSTVTVGWLAVTLGVWAGLRWTERLLLPANISGGTQRVRLAKNLTAVASYLVLAFLVYWAVSFEIPSLIYE